MRRSTKALAIARYTAEDPRRGARRPRPPRRDLCPISISIIRGTCPSRTPSRLGREAEAAALAVDRRLTNTEGATVARRRIGVRLRQFATASARGYRSSRHHIDCSVIGDAGDGAMQRDYWYTAARAAADLEPAETVGRIAGERTARRLGARQLATLECPVLFEAPEAADLIGFFVRRRLGRQPLSQIVVPARLARNAGVRAARVDPRGAAPAARPRQRAVRQRRRGHHAARRRPRRRRARLLSRQLFRAQARLATTGNAGGSHNLVVAHGADDLAGAAAADGSRPPRDRATGAGRQSGHRRFLARRGGLLDRGRRDRVSGRGNHDRRQPASDMFRDIVAVGNDVDRRGVAAHGVDPRRPDDDRGPAEALSLRERQPMHVARRTTGSASLNDPLSQRAARRDAGSRRCRRSTRWRSRRKRSSWSASFPGARRDVGPGQVEALLRDRRARSSRSSRS